jgi:hypothetical protein
MEAFQTQIQQAANLLKETQTKLGEILGADTQHHMLNLNMNTQLENLINKLSFLSGTPYNRAVPAGQDFPPVTNFMGEEISIPKKISRADLTPEKADELSFVEKVNNLYTLWNTIPYDGILNSYHSDADKLVIRGVAKMAGVDGYEDREVNVKYLEDVTEALQSKAANDDEERRIDAELKAQEQAANDANANTKHILTQQDLIDNPDLLEQGLLAGDEVEFDENGFDEEDENDLDNEPDVNPDAAPKKAAKPKAARKKAK